MALGYYHYHCDLDYDKALAEFAIALKRQPNNADLHNAVGAVQRRQGKHQAAVRSFKQALDLDPRCHLKAFDVGLTYGLMHQYGPAEQYLDRSILLAPDWALPIIYKAWLHVFRSGDIQRAREIIAASQDRTDLWGQSYYWWLARIIEPDLRVVLSRSHPDSDTAGYYLHCAQMHRLLGESTEEHAFADSARRILEREIQKHPNQPRYHSRLGLAYAGLRREREAITHGRKAVELLPTSREAFDALFLLVNLAETYVILDLKDEAVAQLDFLLSMPGFVSAPYLRLDPLWEPLRNHAGFRSLIEEGA